MPKDVVKKGCEPKGWAAVVVDAQTEIQKAEKRIDRLRRVVATAQQKLSDGELFPGEKTGASR